MSRLYIALLLILISCSGIENISHPLTTESTQGEGRSYIKNGDFNSNTAFWNIWADADASSVWSVRSGEACIEIQDPGKRQWSISFSQPGLILEKGHRYRVSFRARSNTSKRFFVGAGMSKAPFYGYSGSFHFYPGQEMREYQFTFNMHQESDKNSSIQFSLGNSGERTLWLDDITLTDLGDVPSVYIDRNFPPPRTSFLKRGIQFGMHFASPLEGSHVPQLTEEHFEVLQQDGRFDHIRLPVWWEFHTEKAASYTIDPGFMERVDWAVCQALTRGYPVILNMHWFRALEENPEENKQELLAVWTQITEYFKDYPDHLYFELLNEPHGALDSFWSGYAVELYDTVREISPQRPLIISGPYWTHMDHLHLLDLPERIQQDVHVSIQFHPYVPGDFCFQGSEGNGDGREDSGQIRWLGTEEEKKLITDLLDEAVAWAETQGLPLYNGEFSALSTGESLEEDRLRWIGFIVQECERRQIPWNYYDFNCIGSGVYDSATGEWDENLMNTLFSEN